MFWGLVMQSNKKYTQTIDNTFHISMASLDCNKSTDDVVQVNVVYENTSYLLCSLKKDLVLQVPLDLNFQAGTKISFSCNGNGIVHLTGYVMPEPEPLEEEEEEEEDFTSDSENTFNIESEEDDEIPRLVPVQSKRKAIEQKDGLKNVKKSKTEIKKDEDEDDSEEDDSDDDSEDDTVENLGMDLDSDSDEEDEDDEDEDEEESDEDEKVTEVPQKLSKKQKQKQNQSQNSEQNKKEKKLMNGSDSKVEKEQGKQKKNKENKENKDTGKTETKQEQQQPKKRTLEGGVQVEDIKVGSGTPAKSGKFVAVYYTGRLKNGKKFDETIKGDGFKFRLGKGEVIKGWDIGIAGMKVGGKRRIVIPPGLAYGAKGSPPVVPPNSQLTFEVELKGVN